MILPTFGSLDLVARSKHAGPRSETRHRQLAGMPLSLSRAIARPLAHALGFWPPGRSLQIHDDDTFIVSYPKSGNTWLRFLVGNLFSSKKVDFSSIGDLIPDIYMATANKLAKMRRPRLLKSHEYFDPRYKKVMYVIRDPRDVAISYLHHHVRAQLMPEDFPLDRFVSMFIKGELDSYGNWRENVGSWLGARRGDRDFLVVRYEDLSSNTSRELSRIADFLGVGADDDVVSGAVTRSCLEQMQRLERHQAATERTLGPASLERPFVRSGTVGGWRRELPAVVADRITRAWSTTMAECGYGEAV